ncbi:MAG TPA: nitrite reductase small subunit NirD [Gammaproteobacteria bacterium]|nr:nitrite reductase small subunit NirD [Gammaproteobacteria bacterium]
MSENWIEIGDLNDIPRLGARVVETPDGDIAVFRTKDDRVFAIRDHCPHKGGPLSQGMVTGNKVVCPMHDWKINLASGQAVAPDTGCAATYPVKMNGDTIMLSLTPNKDCSNK